MLVVDHNKNILRIIDTIKADKESYDPDTVGKLRDVKFGSPSNGKEESFASMPYVYVTTKESIQKSSYPYGISANNQIPQVTVEYKIVLVASSKERPQKSEQLMYDLLKNLRTTISADPTFKKESADPIFTRSVLNQVPWEQDTVGQLVTSVTFILSASIGSIGTIAIAGINSGLAIQIISESPDSEIEGFGPQFNTKLELKGYAPTGSQRSKSIEIDHISTITTSLRTLKNTRKSFSLTTVDIDGTIQVHSAILSQLTANISRIDNIKTDLLQFLIIP